MDQDETELVRRAALDEDRDAFSQLVRLHQSGLRHFMARLTHGNRPLAEELAQDAFVKAWFSMRRLKLETSFRSWLYSIAYYTFLDHCRRNRRKAEPLDETLPDPCDRGTGPAVQRLDYEQAMNLLQPEEVALVDLHYKKGFSHSELAEALNLPLGTVKTKLRTVLQRLSTGLMEGIR